MNRRWFVTTFVVLAACSFALAAASPALALETGLQFGTATGLSTQDIRLTVAKTIRVAFGLLGVVAIGIVLTGGFLWMTSSGNEEKLTKAKKVLTNGVIGLTIMLLSFAITQFVISRLTEALYGAGTVTIATEDGGTLPPGGLPGGCADPGGTVPFVCSVSPLAGGVGSYVTVRGYRFGSFTPGTSKVQIGAAEAPIVSCQGSPNWSENLVVVEVPQLDTGRSYPVTVTSSGGTSSNPRSFNVTADPLGPQIACIIPESGSELTGVSITGKLFGTTAGSVRFGGNVTATTSAWEDAGITSVVPAGAQSGEVTVTQGARTSNGYPFTVTCTTGSQCSVSNCCTQGQCVEAAVCAPGGPPSTVGVSCDGDAIAPACQPIACGGGLRCDLASCTCQEGPVITDVSPQTLVSTTDGTAYRRAEDVPLVAGVRLETVMAPNGAEGNYVTIRGRGFGDALCSNDATKRCSRNADCGTGGTCQGLGSVFLMGGPGAEDNKVLALAECASAWTDTQVIAVVESAPVGPIRIATADPAFFDATDDARGNAIEHFRWNRAIRPGLCAITPPSATIGAAVTLTGRQFGTEKGAEDAALFGDQAATTADEQWAPGEITATVPAIAEGPIEVRVRNDGELSNGVTFTRMPEPREPRIQEIVPDRGGGGQYVTIRGENFGSAIGKITFKREADEYEVRPRFPDQCALSWWKGNEITVRIPATRTEWGPPPPPPPPEEFNALGAYEVRVHAVEGASFRASNAVTFTVTTDQPTPGICAITPASGPARTPVQLIGERFGGAVGNIRFFDGVAAAIGGGGADRAVDFNWADGLVRGVLVPATARTGIVRLWQTGAGNEPDRDDNLDAPGLQGNRGSNPVTFEVKDCRAGGAAACASGQVCCSNGTCAATASACPAAGPNAGSYQWTFATGVVPKVPRVVESCDAFSPSPWDSQGQGAQACVNANVRVQLSTSMALTPAAAATGLKVFRCGAGTNVAAAAGGAFEPPPVPPGDEPPGQSDPLLAGWQLVVSEALPDATPFANEWIHVIRGVGAGQAHGGTGYLTVKKSDLAHAKAPTQPRPIDVPRDTATDRHFFAIRAPASLITDTNGTTYTARVFVRDPNPVQNPNRRAGIVIGRDGGPQPTDPGWYQQVASEVPIDGTWKELSVSITFDSGPNKIAPGFVRLYLTGPPADQPANADDVYAVQFDDLEVVRAGDACAVREEVAGLSVVVSSEPGRLQLASNVITVSPPPGNWASGTWYEVIAYGTTGDGGIALKSASDPQLRLDGDKDGLEGGDYRFRFRTRESAAPCAVESVRTTPVEGLATQPGPGSPAGLTTSADLPGLVHLRADGVGDPAACFLLHTAGMPWSWAAQQPDASGPYASVNAAGGRWCLAADDCAIITCRTDADCAAWDPDAPSCDTALGQCAGTPFCATRRCTLPASGQNYFANTVTTRAVKETPVNAVGVPQPAVVRATVEPPGAPTKTGESPVVVRFEKPRVTAVYPTASCQQACPNGRVIAVMNVDLDPATAHFGNARIYWCTQENCRRINPQTGVNELTLQAMVPTSCVANVMEGVCGEHRVGEDPQIVFTKWTGGPLQLEPNASYRVVLRGGASGVKSVWGVPLDGLNYADNATGAIDAYSWVFRTRSEVCGASRIDLSPNPLTLHVVGERATIAAVPFSAPDQCSPAGQPLDPESFSWSWIMSNPSGVVARFTSVQASGTFFPDPLNADHTAATLRRAGPSCSLQCLRPGSQRVPGICGNGLTEPGEECERESGTFPTWCDPQRCLRLGAQPMAAGGTCGDGVIADGLRVSGGGVDCDGTPAKPCASGHAPRGGEECDGARRCAASGPKAGETCAADADCSVTVEGVTASSACVFEFPAWCDPGSCLRKGSGFGSTCGNGGVPGDGEDCDNGNTRDGDGCSSQCLNEGTPRRYDATDAPDGILARCGDGVPANGQSGRPDGGEECDPGTVGGANEVAWRAEWARRGCDYERCVRIGAKPITEPGGTCGDDDPNDPGEQCDDGAVGICSAGSGANAGRLCTIATVAANCGAGGACEELAPVDGDGCSSSCLFEGASIRWRNAATGAAQPSMCGDGLKHTGEACDLGASGGFQDPSQLLQAIGQGRPQEGTGTQTTPITAEIGVVSGGGAVQLQCGFTSDAACNYPAFSVTPTSHGIDQLGCCRARPAFLVASVPGGNTTNVCRNIRITVRFDQPMDPGSVGVVTDLTTGQSTTRGVIFEKCKDVMVGCRLDVQSDWEPAAATPVIVDALNGVQPISELHLNLSAALAPLTSYRVRVLDASDGPTTSIKSVDGVQLRDYSFNTWKFTTGSQICSVSRIQVHPPSYLLQRVEDRAKLRAEARTAVGDAPITSISAYAWTYAWGASVADIAVTAPITTGPTAQQYLCNPSDRCAFKPAEPTKDGDAIARATATITANTTAPTCTAATAADVCAAGQTCTGGSCVGESFTGSAPLRTLICENPWPTVEGPAGAATWSPYPAPDDPSAQAALLRSERLSIAFCRDQGDRKVCRPPGAESPEPLTGAHVCASDNDCANIAGTKCLLALRDDLPAFSGVVTNDPPEVNATVDELRKEFLFLPRQVVTDASAAYCSVSGERCDPSLAGICPPGEFCRVGNDAIGLRMYENVGHVGAAAWLSNQGFTDSATPIETDGYRGVQAGRSTYLNVANTGSLFTNVAVLSFNDGAVGETKEILRQVLSGIRFNTDLMNTDPIPQNDRLCVWVGNPSALTFRCTGSRQQCWTPGQACSGTNAGTCEAITCASDADCRWSLSNGTTFTGNVCRASKDKLTRDTRRLEDLNEIRLAIDAYGRSRARCSISPQSCDPSAAAGQPGACPGSETCFTSGPELAAGTFIPGLTSSRWPSWQAELGTAIGLTPLPVDPINAFGGACVANTTANASYDQATCWNQQAGTYAVPINSYLYQYRRQPNGQWSLSTAFEYAGTTPPAGQPNRDWLHTPASTINANTASLWTSFSVTGRCGDSVTQSGEECDPPGTTLQQSCTTAAGASGFRVRTCQQNCTWSIPDATWNAVPIPAAQCSTACGNFVRDGVEQCDVGPAGGRVSAGHPVAGAIPGITIAGQFSLSVNTQYECSTACQWTGGRCGDVVVQPTYGEQCDGSANVATTPTGSSPTTQYSCTASTNSNPCKATGGFCGDGVVQDNGTDTKACRSTVGGVWGREPCTSDAQCLTGETCVVRVRRATPNRSETCDGNEVRSCISGTGAAATGELTKPAAIAGVGTLDGGPPPNGVLPWSTTSGDSRIRFDDIVIRDQGGANGSIRITLETSNDSGDLSNLTRDLIETPSVLAAGQTINDFNPLGAQGGAGLSHRLRIQTRPVGGAFVTHGTVWALASNAHQVSSMVMEGIPSGTRDLRIVWDNDWSSAPFDSNLMLHRVRVEGVQSRSCTAPGATGACTWAAGWSACTAAAAACGDGDVDAGEECDDGGKGRCSNDLAKECQQDTECGPSNTCLKDVDACTSACQNATCGDGIQLAPTCRGGEPSKVGTPCRSNAECGPGGACATEACDIGVSNWRAQCTGPADARCVPNAACEYGRTCNYCVQGTCTIATKQGGFCGDRIKNGAEQCDFADGTNQPAANRTATNVSGLSWQHQICNASCTATCPPAYQPQPAKFGATGDAVEVEIANTGEKVVRFPGCRLLGGLRFDVAFDDGIGMMDVVIITDRSGSMSTGSPSTISRVISAIADDGGLIDQLFAGRGGQPVGSRPSRVRIGLVSYRNRVTTTDRALSGVNDRDALKAVVRAYDADGGTKVEPALTAAKTMLQGATGGAAKVAVLLSDGATDDDQYVSGNNAPADTAATAIRNLPASLFTVLIGSSGGGSDAQMHEWSSDPNDRYSFAGTNVEALYQALGQAVSTVTFTVFQGSFGSATVKPTTRVSFDGNDIGFSTAGLDQLCDGLSGGLTDTQLKVRADFLGASGAKVTLRDPKANMCTGPPWRP